MSGSKIHFAWQDRSAAKDFRTGVSLHSHTLHSQECLWFLPRYLQMIPGISHLYRSTPDDFARAYWTPPLGPTEALRLERRQITDAGFEPIVSITDHDDIEAPMTLQVTSARKHVPVSVEWTVPYESAYLHIGIHNLPAQEERSWMKVLAAHTAAPDPAKLVEILQALHQIPDVLIVLNHPFWREETVDEPSQLRAIDRVLRECVDWIHAFELNGTRPWKENVDTIELGSHYARPVISGGDRHGCEPNACINLTNARSFGAFASEVREGYSTLMFMPQYREPMALRILETGWDVLRPYPEYPGREKWTDRIFYRDEEGIARSLSQIWDRRAPWPLQRATEIVQLLANPRLRGAMRFLIEKGEVRP